MNINQLMKQMQNMQQQMGKMQDELASKEFIGSSGGGLVNITLNGKGVLTKVKIDPSLMNKEEVDILEDLLVAATNEARNKMEEAVGGMMGGLQLPPGMKFPF